MKELQFATPESIKAETPKGIKTIYRMLMFLSSIWGFASLGHMIPAITDHAALIVNNALLIGNFAVYQFCQMFGYATPKDPNAQ